MDNPGLRAFSDMSSKEGAEVTHGDIRVHEPQYIKVSYRRTAEMAAPRTDTTNTNKGAPRTEYFDGVSRDGEGYLQREDVETPPPLMGGGNTPGPSADNGAYGADPWIEAHNPTAGVRAQAGTGTSTTQVPGEVRQHANSAQARPGTNSTRPLQTAPALQAMDQVAEQERAQKDRLEVVQQSDGRNENPAYDAAKQRVDQKIQVRRTHALHQASAPRGWESVGPDSSAPHIPAGGSSNSFGPVCETCWLGKGIKNVFPEGHREHVGHEFKPMVMEPGQRFSSINDESRQGREPDNCETCWLKHGEHIEERDHNGSDPMWKGESDHEFKRFSRVAAQVPNYEDPAYPYSGRVDPEDTTDLDNLQSGDDTFRPHNPHVDRVMNHLQGLPDMSRNDPHLMDKVNEILNEGPDTEEGNRGADALAGGLNTIFDSMRETEGQDRDQRLQAGKDAIDAHFETAKLTHKQHVKQLHDDWLARGGHKTGEPRPVERFSPRYTKPQQIVPDPSNPFPELESPILYAGKCEGCGKKLYDSADSSGDPRGALGDHTLGTLDAAEYDATDTSPDDPRGERRMHGPSALICPECDNDSDRHNAIEDKYRGHKAGDKTGGGYWGWPEGADRSDWKARKFIPTTYGKDRKGKWHNPGEKPGSCPECDQGITGFHRPRLAAIADWSDLLRVAHHDPDQDIKDVLAVQGTHGNWDYDHYMHGMFNGMELVRSIHAGDEPKFRKAPEHWGFEKAGAVEGEDDPRGEIENLINSLPEAGKARTPDERPWTLPTRAQEQALQDAGFEIHHEHVGDGWVPQKYWVKQDGLNDQYIAPSREEPRGGYWETSVGPRDHWAGGSDEEIRPTVHTTFDNAFQRVTDPDTWYRENQADQDAEMWNRGKRVPGKMAPFVPAARPANPGLTVLNRVQKQSESDEEFWARQPDVMSTRMYQPTGPDAAGQEFLGDEDPDWDDDESLEDMLPRNTSLAEHAHVLRCGFKWDGDEQNPEYTSLHNREIRDSDGRKGYADEGHVIERNTHVMAPNLDENPEPLASPWMHTYYPAGQSDDEGLVGAHNTAHSAVRAAHQLALWGARHPKSQELLKGYRYVGDERPYDSSEELPHEVAMRENSAR